MLTLPSNLIFGLWVLVGICSLALVILTALLIENLVYYFHRLFRTPGCKEDKPPARKPIALWITFWGVAILGILGTAAASVAEPPRLDAILTPSPAPIFTFNSSDNPGTGG